jgi:hypothetical protein
MRVLMLGGRGAVGTVLERELARAGHVVTSASRSAPGGAALDLHADLAPLTRLARAHDVVVNASGVERAELGAAVGGTPLVEISASGAHLEALRGTATGPLLLGAGLVPGLSTVLVAELGTRPGDVVDVLLMLGAGEAHGPAAVDWTSALVGTDVHRPPERHPVRNLRSGVRAPGPDGRLRRYLRADLPDHLLLAPGRELAVRSYLTLGSAPMTAALALVGRVPRLRGLLRSAPHLGDDRWHLVVRSRRTGQRREAEGAGQSEATGRLTALAVESLGRRLGQGRGPWTMADLVDADEGRAALTDPSARSTPRT